MYGGQDHEPELQKMAAFLRERCNNRQYGLEYLNQHKTHIRIPWPTVPRANEELSGSFEMFKEWAYLSFRKRGNRGEQLENEPLSAQKHRFRNALARADGLKFRKELSVEGVRVYEFVDTKKEKENLENGHRMHNDKSSPPNYTYNDRHEYNPDTPMQRDISDSCSTVEYREWEHLETSPSTVHTTSPGQTPNDYRMAPDQMNPDLCSMVDGEPVTSLTTLLDEMINLPEPGGPTTSTYQSTNYPVPNTYQAPPHPLSVPSVQARPTNGLIQLTRPQPHHLFIKVLYQGEEVMRKAVTNSVGFRVYFGNNIPDMSRLLDNNQRAQLSRLTKYHCDELYGPDSIEQVEMPASPHCGTNQSGRMKQILDNMDRGLVFFLEHGTGVDLPNLYSIRLCQTRVFPYDTNVNENTVLREGLQRMQWAQIFDANEFARKMDVWRNGQGLQPSAVIKLSVGQKPKLKEGNLVSLQLTIVKAQVVVDSQLEVMPDEICISNKNSMDVAAQMLQHRIQSSFCLGDESSTLQY